MPNQRTIQSVVQIAGRGLFSGQPSTCVFKPSPAGSGVAFVRSDLGAQEIPCLVNNVTRRPRRTALRSGEAVVETCEHVLSAVAALGIDNLRIHLDASEVPGLDGSSLPFVETLASAGVVEQEAPRKVLVVREPVFVKQDDAMLAALPGDGPGLQIVYDLNYPNTPIGRQLGSFVLGQDDYVSQIAPSRTYVLEAEAQMLREAGVGVHLTPDEVLVVGPQGPLGNNRFRFPDEAVRHKILDLIGDLSLLGAGIEAKIIAVKSGHSLNHTLVRQLVKHHRQQQQKQLSQEKALIDIRRLMRILPHRYPMLLVDRVVEIEGNRRAVGVKNVTINEPFFQGHYPGTPIMPGVLIVEAMAQLSGVLIGQALEHTGKLAVLLSLDKVKLRKPATPGDQLILEAESLSVRRRVAHMRCRAYIGKDLAAEAEVKFMLVDDEQR